jgi:formylglycine-generating enzyme required for sulfatase activity
MRKTLCLLFAAAAAAAGQETVNSIGTPFVLIKPGSFTMGTAAGEWGHNRNESPQRTVTITRAFHMGKHEVTNKEFMTFVNETKYDPAGKNGESDFQFLLYMKDPKREETGDMFPVTWVSWFAALRFCNWLSEKEGRPPVYVFGEKEGEYGLPSVGMARPYDGGYRLPTEAEWEYAARAGTATAFSFGPDDRDFKAHAHSGTGKPLLMKVDSGKPNPLGLHQMHGNVFEWCWDRYSPGYENYETTDPSGPVFGGMRVLRGGASLAPPVYGRSGARMPEFPTVTRFCAGFRLVFNSPSDDAK